MLVLWHGLFAQLVTSLWSDQTACTAAADCADPAVFASGYPCPNDE